MKSLRETSLRVLFASLLMASLMCAAGCGSQQASSSAESASTQGSQSAPAQEQYDKVFQPDNIVSTFIDEKFYDQKVTDETTALAAVKSVYGRIGADDTTELQATAVRPTETGTTYYIFNQVAGDVLVYGASTKLIVDKDNEVIGLVSAILPQVTMPKAEDWQITAAQAEEVVVKKCEEDGHAGVKPEEGATEQVLITVPDTNSQHQFAWVVYTPNYLGNSEMGYLAHYVDASGPYLYAIPIAEPHNADAEAGDVANFNFSKFEQSTWKGTVTLHDGTTKEIEVPALVDPSNNATILADSKRKILCADYADWHFDEKLSPRVSSDNTFENTELLAYDTFIKVWDFYESIGWSGPDDEGTPTLLLMDYVNDDRERADNAMYMGRQNGFQTFTFNRLNPDGENMDIIAHEFTHCVTSTTMTTNVYRNEMGAINEGMSDVLGNLVEMLVVNNPDSAWLMGDGSGIDRTLRSMKDPHTHAQPEFRWDTYYAPSVTVGTVTNDNGGVHLNSSMLNIVSYKLDQAGMEPADQFYFWMNVALAMTPRTDYAQMAQLLPWCLEQSGYSQYIDALKAAISEAGYANAEEPTTPPEGTGKIAINYQSGDLGDNGLVRFQIISADDSMHVLTYPSDGAHATSATLPAGDYQCIGLVGSESPIASTVYAYQDGTWTQVSDGEIKTSLVHVDAGQTTELSSQGLPASSADVPKNE